ncbi:MAG: MFS transporter [Coriobacteriia bacterium]
MAETKKLSLLNIIGILALFCTMSEFTILTPSIASFAAHFANTDFTTILFANSVTGIVSVPVSIAAGALLHKVGFRRAGIIGILVMTLGGAFPFLMPGITNYNIVIGSRIIVGIGLGIMFPVGGATIIAFFTGIQRSRLLGLGIMVQFIFSIIYTIVAGFLTEIGWNFSFLAYLVAIIPLIVVILFMPEAKHVVTAGAKAKSAEKDGLGEKMPNAVWGYAFYGLIVWIAMVTVQLIASTILAERSIGDAGVASIVISVCGVGIIFSGLAFPYSVKLFKNKIFAAGALLTAVGMIPCFIAQSAFMYGLGVFFVGFGSATFFTAAQNSAGNISPKSRIPFVNGIMTSMMNLGPFFAPYFVVGSTMTLPQFGNSAAFLTCCGMAAVAAIIGLFMPLRAIMMKSPEVAEEPGMAVA